MRLLRLRNNIATQSNQTPELGPLKTMLIRALAEIRTNFGGGSAEAAWLVMGPRINSWVMSQSENDLRRHAHEMISLADKLKLILEQCDDGSHEDRGETAGNIDGSDGIGKIDVGSVLDPGSAQFADNRSQGGVCPDEALSCRDIPD